MSSSAPAASPTPAANPTPIMGMLGTLVGSIRGGDMETARAQLTPDVKWTSVYPASGLSFGGEAQGIDAVCALLKDMFSSADMVGLEVLKLMEDKDSMIVVAVETLKSIATGKTFTNPYCCFCTVRDGKLATIRLISDSFTATRELGVSHPGKRA